MGWTVTLTVAGDRGQIDVQAETDTPVGDLIGSWAQQCSSVPASDLVALSGDHRTLFDPSEHIANLGLGYGSIVRLVSTDEAMSLLTVDRPPPADPTDAASLLAAEPRAIPPRPAAPPSNGVNSPQAPQQRWPPQAVEEPTHAPQGRSPAVVGSATGETSYNRADLRRFGMPVGTLIPPWNEQATTAEDGNAEADNEDAQLPAKVPGTKRLSAATKAALSPRSNTASPRSAFAKATTPTVGERYRQSRRSTNRQHNLEVLIRSTPLPRCMVVAVVSPKGGVGKTTITALLGMMLAELRRDPVLALDANPDFGNLGTKLGDPEMTVMATDEISTWLAARPSATPADLAALLGAGPHGLRFLPTPIGDTGRMVAAADFDVYQTLISRLRHYEGIILVDGGTGLLDPPVRAALESADQIVVVTDSSPDTADLIQKAAPLLPQQTPTWMVANKIPDRGSKVDLSKVREALPRLRGVVVLPEQRLVENIVTPTFDWAEGPQAWQEPIRELAARLVKNWHD